jgi:hypothetical protein
MDPWVSVADMLLTTPWLRQEELIKVELEATANGSATRTHPTRANPENTFPSRPG